MCIPWPGSWGHQVLCTGTTSANWKYTLQFYQILTFYQRKQKSTRTERACHKRQWLQGQWAGTTSEVSCQGSLSKTNSQAREMIQWVKALAVKTENPQFDTQERSDCCELVSDPSPTENKQQWQQKTLRSKFKLKWAEAKMKTQVKSGATRRTLLRRGRQLTGLASSRTRQVFRTGIPGCFLPP